MNSGQKEYFYISSDPLCATELSGKTEALFFVLKTAVEIVQVFLFFPSIFFLLLVLHSHSRSISEHAWEGKRRQGHQQAQKDRHEISHSLHQKGTKAEETSSTPQTTLSLPGFTDTFCNSTATAKKACMIYLSHKVQVLVQVRVSDYSNSVSK